MVFGEIKTGIPCVKITVDADARKSGTFSLEQKPNPMNTLNRILEQFTESAVDPDNTGIGRFNVVDAIVDRATRCDTYEKTW